jgi:hypothetical protein
VGAATTLAPNPLLGVKPVVGVHAYVRVSGELTDNVAGVAGVEHCTILGEMVSGLGAAAMFTCK